MKNTVEGFKNEIDLKIFENRLAEINPTCFLIWKVRVNLALRVSDVLKITIEQAENYLLTGNYMAIDKKTGKVSHVKINENTSIALEEAIVSDENPFLFVGEGNRTSKSKKRVTRQAVDKYFKIAVLDENLNIHVETYTMRKTWDNLAYSKGYKLELIIKRLNHSSQSTTLLYLGITDSDMNKVVAELNI